MKKAYLLMTGLTLILLIPCIPSALCYPPAGSDYMDPTTISMEIEATGTFNETIRATGPTNISRSTPYDPGDHRIEVDTEIVSMNLTGTGIYTGPIAVVESPSKTSNGTIKQLILGEEFGANSSFELFVEIQTTLPFPYQILHNDNPIFMQTIIYAIPPNGSQYDSSPAVIPLKDEQENVIWFMKNASLKIGTGPIPIGGIAVSVDKFGLLAPYLGLVSAIVITMSGTAVYVKRCKREKSKQ